MPIDGFVINAVKNELSEKLIGGRIDKIYQPEKDEIILNIRTNTTNNSLLISSNSSYPRIYFTNIKKDNPSTAPTFCMLLRKHIKSGIVKKIFQPDFDRIIIFVIESKNELYDIEEKYLIIELMGKYSNIILTDHNYYILDSIQRINTNISRKRQLYPGIKYTSPPGDQKISPLNIDRNNFIDYLKSSNSGSIISNAIINYFYGISPLIIEELCYLARIDSNSKLGELNEIVLEKIFNNLSLFAQQTIDLITQPTLYCKNSKILNFHCLPISLYKNCEQKKYNSICQLIHDFYYTKEMQHNLSEKSSYIRKLLSSLISKNQKKINLLKNSLAEAQKRELYKTYGDLLLANVHICDRNSKEIILHNFYIDELITIPLNTKYDIKQNAQNYYKKYSKLKNAEASIYIQLDLSEKELNYLNNVMLSIQYANNVNEIEEIKQELIETGYIKYKKLNKSKKIKSEPIKTFSTDGSEILIGKNNFQNDFITHKIAKKTDLWLHAKDVPGSHVIIRNTNDTISDEALELAAGYAAYYSKSRNSTNVEVIYTEVKNINKPSNSKPGFVTFNKYHTISVVPKAPQNIHSEIIT